MRVFPFFMMNWSSVSNHGKSISWLLFPFFLTSEYITSGTVYHLLNCFCLPPLANACFVSSLRSSRWYFSLLVSEARGAESCPDALACLCVKSNDGAVQLSDTHSKRGRSWKTKSDKTQACLRCWKQLGKNLIQFKGHFCFARSEVQCVVIKDDYAAQ